MKRGPKIGTYCGRPRKPDNEVGYYALYYRQKRAFEEAHPGETFRRRPDINYEPRLTKEDLIKMGVNVSLVLNESNPILILRHGSELKQKENKYGYRYVSLNNKACLVHRIVYAWFYEEITEGMTVDHINGDKTNNIPTNLRLLTRAENTKQKEVLKRRNFTLRLTNLYYDIMNINNESDTTEDIT